MQRRTNDLSQLIWGPTIVSLKPLRVMKDRVNIKIVLAERDGIETGFYVIQPISSFRPDKKYFLEQVLLSKPEDQEGTLYLYKLAQPEKK